MEQKYKRFDELSKWFEEEEKNIFEELHNDIQQLTTFKIAFSGNSIRSGWKGQIAMLRATINFVNNEGKFDFASDFTIEFDRNELIFNYGCVGHFGKEMVYYIERTKLMAKLFEKWEELETKYLEKLNNKTFKEFFDLYYELERYERDLIEKVRKETYNKTLETIKQGQTYYFGKGEDMWGVITRITPKRVYYELYWKNYNGSTIRGGEKFENQRYFVESLQEQRYRLKED
jgi:predicted DNA-binding WGR domain protein